MLKKFRHISPPSLFLLACHQASARLPIGEADFDLGSLNEVS